MASKLSRVQVKSQNWVSSQRQEHIGITPFDNKLISLLDGTRDKTDLIKELIPFFANNELVMSEQSQPVTDVKMIETRLPEFVKTALDRYAALGLIVK